MSWIAVAIAGGAVVGAISNKASADAANKPKKNYTDQTSTQSPYLSDQTQGDVQAILAGQRGIYQQGASQIVPDGKGGYKTVYAAVPSGTAPPTAPASPPAGGSSGGPGLKNQASASSVNYTTRPDGRVVPVVAPKPKGGGGAGTPKPGTPPAKPSGPDVSSPDAIFRQTATAGLQAGNDPATKASQAQVQNILNSVNAGAKDGGTGFAGYNPIADRLAQKLETEGSKGDAADLLRSFISGQSGSGGGPGAGTGTGGGFLSPAQQSAAAAQDRAMVAGGGGAVPDATGNGTFGTYIKQMLSGDTDKTDMQALLDKANSDSMANYWKMAAQQDAAAQGGGRFGGSQAEFDKTAGQQAAMGEIAGRESATRYQDYNDQRSAALAALGLVNTRDLGAMNDATQRAQIAASSASSAGSLALGERGQNLNAIQSILQNQQFGEGQLGGLAGQLSGDQLSAMGHAPGLAGVAAQGLADANAAGSGMVAQENAGTAARSVNQQGALARAGMNLNLAEFNAGSPQNSVNNYLSTVLHIGGMGGTSTTQGTNVVAGAGISPTGAALTGAVGGAAQGYGLYNLAQGYGR